MLYSLLFPHSVSQQLPPFGIGFLIQLTWGEHLDFFQADFTRLNGASPGPVDEWLRAIFSFVFPIVPCSTPLFLFSPLSFVCVALQLGIWPAIDKTQSLTMFGT